MKNNHIDTKSDELIKLLSGLKSEPAFTDDFEQKFLNEFHHRVSEQQEIKPLDSLGEKLRNYFANISFNKWAYKTAATAMAMIIIALVISDVSPNGYVSVQSIFSRIINSNLQQVSSDEGVPFENKESSEEKSDKDMDALKNNN